MSSSTNQPPWGRIALGTRVVDNVTGDVGTVRAQRRDGLMVWVAFDDVEQYGDRPLGVDVDDLTPLSTRVVVIEEGL